MLRIKRDILENKSAKQKSEENQIDCQRKCELTDNVDINLNMNHLVCVLVIFSNVTLLSLEK